MRRYLHIRYVRQLIHIHTLTRLCHNRFYRRCSDRSNIYFGDLFRLFAAAVVTGVLLVYIFKANVF